MADNELLLAENCHWEAGLRKRRGINKYSTTDFSGASHVLRGGIRAYINGAWYTIVAYDDNTDIGMHYGTGTTFVEIATSTFTKGYNVEFTELNGYVIAVNGHDKPEVIYYDAAWICKKLEALDIRTIDELNWYAGQWDESGTGATQFIDDTTDAQDAGVDDFQVGVNVANDGCYISSDYTFNKILFVGCEQAGGAPVAEYKYWDGAAWTTVGTLVTDPDWTGAPGGKTVEFNIPLDADGTLLWVPFTDVTTTGIVNKYILRIRFTTEPTAAFSCDYLEVSHTQYLTEIMENERPHAVCTHNAMIHMASNNVINVSPLNEVIGWRPQTVEIFTEGGPSIIGMVSRKDTLDVFKQTTIYTLTGNILDGSGVRSRPLTSVGATSQRSIVLVGDQVFFVADDGIYKWNGVEAVRVSGHIQSDLDSYTLTDSCGVNYKGSYWVDFPSDPKGTLGVLLRTDPDTFRQAAAGTDIGEGRTSFYKYTGYLVEQFINCNGSGDTKYLLGLASPSANTYVVRCDYADTDAVTTTANITMKVQTRYSEMDNFQTEKNYGRLKIRLDEVSNVLEASKTHTVILYKDDGDDSATLTLRVPYGTGIYKYETSVPYNIDGETFSFYLEHAGSSSCKLYGFSVEYDVRRY